MNGPVGITYSTYLAQAALAVVLTIVLVWFDRLYHRGYLRDWARSWLAFAACMVASAIGYAAAEHYPVTSVARLLVVAVAHGAAFLQLAWLLFGAYELNTHRKVERSRRRAVFIALAALTLVLVGAGALMAPDAPGRMFVRVGVRSLAAACTFSLVFLWVRRSVVWPDGAGRRVVQWAFAIYALDELQYFVASVLTAWGVSAPAFLDALNYLGFVDFLLQSVIGLGMVIGLLEEEREQMMHATGEIERLAYHDPSTELPNRRLLLDNLHVALAHAQRHGGRAAVLHLDIDRFKVVNDAWSQSVGDALLRAVGERLRRTLRGGDTVARLGGDSFALLLAELESEQEAHLIAERVALAIRQPFAVGEREIHLTASTGVSLYPEHGNDAATLMQHADAAMYRAKEDGRDRTVFFQPAHHRGATERVALENDLRRAFSGNELRLYYQPIFEIASGNIVRFEALLRWEHPARGLLRPDLFLAVADNIGLADALDQWVLRTACTEAALWRARVKTRPPQVAVNLSARVFQHPDLVQRIDTVLADTGLGASSLELEITESVAMQHAEGTLAIMRSLEALGVHLAIDDFGTGYSSLSYLRNFPIDTIKIDRAFVRDLAGTEAAQTLTAGIIALAHSLGLAVVAEGVETEEQRRILRDQRCELMQGYLLGKPMPPREADTLLQMHRNSDPTGFPAYTRR